MKKIIVAGGGIAGLTTGIYARLAGYEAEIYEKNPVVGGECMGWNRQGYHIDNCVHWMTGTSPEKEIYQVGKDVGVIGEGQKFINHDYFLQVALSMLRHHRHWNFQVLVLKKL